jgi:hypothetical protein
MNNGACFGMRESPLIDRVFSVIEFSNRENVQINALLVSHSQYKKCEEELGDLIRYLDCTIFDKPVRAIFLRTGALIISGTIHDSKGIER